MTLARAVRRRAVHDLDTLLAQDAGLPLGNIPIDDDRWDQFEERLRPRVASFLQLRSDVSTAVALETFQPLRAAARIIGTRLQVLDGHVRAAAMFDHPRRLALVSLHAATHELASAWHSLMITTDVNDRERVDNLAAAAADKVVVVLDEVGSRNDAPTTDPWLSAFGVERSVLLDANGRFSSALLVASFYGRLDELRSRLGALFSGFGGGGLGSEKAISYAPALLGSSDPIEVVQMAMSIRDILKYTAQQDPDRVRSVLGRLSAEVDRSYANSVMITDTRNRLAVETRSDRSAMLELELYRRVCEGQLRPWGWALVCLHTGADGEPPMIAELRDRLRAIDDEVTRAFAETLETSARNAAAHEDYRWDPRLRQLIGSQGAFDAEELSELSYRGLALMSAAELAWALASSVDPTFRSPEISTTIPSVLHAISALNRFATNHIRPVDWYLDGEGLIVEVAALANSDFNPCAQALVEAATIIKVDHIAVRLSPGSDPVMVASRPVLDAILPVWFHTVSRRPEMPPAVFLPIFFESRLLIESPQQATRAALWLALNEGVHAINGFIDRRDAGFPLAGSLRILAEDLWLASESLRICAIAVPEQHELRGRVYGLLRDAHIHARAIVEQPHASSPLERQSLNKATRAIVNLCQELPPCAALPTVDPAPLQ